MGKPDITPWWQRGALCLLGLALALTSACQRPASASAESQPPAARRAPNDRVDVPEGSPLRARLRIAAVQTKDVRRTLEAPAEVEAEPARLTRITPPLPGRVVQLYVHFGDTVTAGQPLLALDSPDLVAAQSDYLRARSALAQAERTLARQQDLQKNGVGAQREVEQAQTDRELATAEADTVHLKAGQAARFGVAVWEERAGTVLDEQIWARHLTEHGVEVTAIRGEHILGGNQVLNLGAELFHDCKQSFNLSIPRRMWLLMVPSGFRNCVATSWCESPW